MFAFTSLALLALAAIARADTGDLHIDTPTSATQCQPVTINISGSVTGPYHAFIVLSEAPCGDSLDEVLNISGTSFTYTPKANVAGKTISIALENDDGTAEGWSAGFTVAAGSDSCETSNTPAATTPAAAHTTATHASVAATYSAPVNAGSSDNTSGTVSDDTSGASRAAVGLSGVLALVGAAVVSFAL